MTTATFRYPVEFVTLPDYTAHAGHSVEIIRELGPDESDHHADPENCERMFKVRSLQDGWEGDAFESELEIEECGP